jgi:YHS domain-containing protein
MGHDHSHDDHAQADHAQAEGGHCGGHGDSAATSHHGSNLLGPSAEDLAECPVMRGSTVVKADAEAKGLFRDYEGQRYWFCCAACEAPFDADPAKYVTAA